MDAETYHSAQMRADYCRIFSNVHRVLIAWALVDRELSVSEIAEEIHTTLQNTSQHLRLMKDRGLVEPRREGQTVYYKIADHALFKDCAIFNHQHQTNQL